MGAHNFYVYILASRIGGTLYIGVTNELIRRVAEHRLKTVKSFTEKYDVVRLVYFEQFDDPNLNWNDLYPGLRVLKESSWINVPLRSSPGLAGRSSIPEQAKQIQGAAAYWIVRLRGR